MAFYRDKIVKQAQNWLGRNMYDGTHKEIVDVYNSHKPLARGFKMTYHDHWCATFVSAVAIKCGYTKIIPTEVGCEQQIKLFKSIGRWQERDNHMPKAGDIIYYDWDDNGSGDCTGWADHVGIVEKVKLNTITVIEGNLEGKVARRELQVNAKYIRGYGMPAYDSMTTPQSTVKPKTKYKVGDRVIVSGKLYASSNATTPTSSVNNKSTCITRVVEGTKHPYNTTGDLGWMDEASIKLHSTKKSIDTVAKEVIAGKWGNGTERKQKLISAGYNYNEVQKRVNELVG